VAEHRTAEESRNANVLAMGEELGLLYSELWQQLVWLHTKWEQYVVLFGKTESRVKLLNASAPMFFRVVQDTLWEDSVLHVARLTDSPASMNKPNLSIRRIADLIDDQPVRTVIEALVQEALDASEFCRDWRNRHIAHRDLDLALKRAVNPLKTGSREKVGKAMDALEAVLNAVAEHYLASTTSFDMDTSGSGALSLLYVLDDGVRAEKSRKERAKNGTSTPEDRERREL
jgi:hypothetical protein